MLGGEKGGGEEQTKLYNNGKCVLYTINITIYVLCWV